MLAPETIVFLEGGCALIIGTVGATGEPHASRGWAVTVTAATDQPHVRLLVDLDDTVALDNLATTKHVAVTGADVQTLRSVQFKGDAVALEDATDDDLARSERFCEELFDDIVTIDGTPRALIERIRARKIRACIVRVSEVYDQTPGPVAGRSIAGGSP